MRTSILSAAILGLLAAGCAGELSGTGEGGDDTNTPANCGNGQMDPGETCDDGNTANGDGCSSACVTESTGGTPRVMGSVDKPTVATELGKTENITLTLQGLDGFSGDATIAPSIVDGTGAAIPGVTVTGPTTLTVTEGAVTGVYAVKVASNATGTNLAATLKLDVTSSAEPVALSSMIDVAAIFTVSYAAGTGGTVANHPMQSGAVGNAVTVKRGTKIRFTNNDTARHITHGQGFFPHEDQTNGGAAGGTYELNTIAATPGQTGQLGCHETNHGGAAGYITFTME